MKLIHLTNKILGKVGVRASVWLFTVIMWLPLTGVYSQSGEIDYEAIVKGDDVYIYQMQNMRADYGYNVYRQDQGQSDFVLLNEEPVSGVLYPEQIRSVLGDDYQRVKHLLEAEELQDVYFELRGNSPTAKLYALAFPDLAAATNRLFIDGNAPIGQEVTYRIELLNQRDEPTGVVENFNVHLEEKEILQPEITDISNHGADVDVTWTFPTGEIQDHVFQFNLLYETGDDNLRRATDVILLRDRSRGEYTFRFTFEDMNRVATFYIAAVDYAGTSGPLSEPFEILIRDNIPPSRVTNVQTAVIEDDIRIIWPMSRELDVTGYHVYRSLEPNENFSRLNDDLLPMNNPEFVDSEIEPGNRYYYRITAVNENDNESEKSTVVARLIPDYTPPPVPADLSAAFDERSGNVRLSWKTDPLPDNFKTFHLFRREAPGEQPVGALAAVNLEDVKETVYTDDGIEGSGFVEGKTYQYAIISADSSRNMSDTTYTFVHIPNITPPEPPRRVNVDNRNGVRVLVSWSASMSTDVVNYQLFRKKEEGEFTEIQEFPIQKRQYRDEDIETGEEFTYAVAAVDSSGNVSEIRESDSVFIRSSSPPRRVRNVQAVAVRDSIHVKWEPVVSDALEGYKLYVSDRSTGIYEEVFDEPRNITEYTKALVDDNIWFRVTALDRSGNESRPSEPAKLVNPQ